MAMSESNMPPELVTPNATLVTAHATKSLLWLGQQTVPPPPPLPFTSVYKGPRLLCNL
jgi:hypothetical protein